MAAAAAQRAGPRRRRRLANSQRTEPPPEEVEGRGSRVEWGVLRPADARARHRGLAREVRAAVSSAVAIEKAMTGIPHRLVSFAPDPFPVAISHTTRGTL